MPRVQKTNTPIPYTFVPEQKNKDWVAKRAKENRRSMSAEINLILEQARIAEKEAKND